MFGPRQAAGIRSSFVQPRRTTWQRTHHALRPPRALFHYFHPVLPLDDTVVAAVRIRAQITRRVTLMPVSRRSPRPSRPATAVTGLRPRDGKHSRRRTFLLRF
jgi:hypothetical protein